MFLDEEGDKNVSVDIAFVSNFHTTNKSPNFKTLAQKINFFSV